MQPYTIKPGYLTVTQVLSIFSNLHKIDPQVLDNAAKRGTLVHTIIEALEDGLGEDDTPHNVNGYIYSYKQWAYDKKFIPRPDRFYCEELYLTGKIDAIYQDGNDLVLVDYKTPERESKSWRMQASAYAYLARKSGYNITRIEFVKLSKIGNEPKVFVYDEDMELFMKMLDSYRYFFKDSDQENILDLI